MNRQKNNSVNRRKIIRCNTKSSASGETLPIDLILEIFLRLPVNSIEVFRCVSKQWSSLLRRPDFTELFLKNSLSQPRLLFIFRIGSNWHFFSSPQPRDFGENLSIVPTDYHRSYSGSYYKEICQSVNGFIYLNDKRRLKRKIVKKVPIIYNPCTGQIITLPKVETAGYHDGLKYYFGYDPIRKQFKVLCRLKTNHCEKTTSIDSYQVLTLGTRELSWRKIECSFLHYSRKECNGICINGVLYYIAWRWIHKHYHNIMIIVCFDVRSEKFSFIEIEKAPYSTLIEYKGKLGVILCFDYGSSLAEVWVLDDTKKVKWSKHTINLSVLALMAIESISATDTGEIVWPSSHSIHQFSSVFYYNMETRSSRRIEINGLRDKLSTVLTSSENSLFTFTNHVENLMFL